MSCEHEVRFTIKPTDDACRFHFDVRAYKDRIVAPDEYSGVTEVTPSDTEQVLATKDKLVRDDITVNPAPTEALSTTSNGTFTPSNGKVGFSAVTVDVNPDLRPLSVSENGTYQPDGFDGYSQVSVDVHNHGYSDDFDDFYGGNILALISHRAEYINTGWYPKSYCEMCLKASKDTKYAAYEDYFAASFSASRIGIQASNSLTSCAWLMTPVGSLVIDKVMSTSPVVLCARNFYAVSETATKPLVIFHGYYKGSLDQLGGYNFYGLKCYEFGTLVKKYVPWLDENNVPCVHELVDDEYFYNVGTGTFGYIDLGGNEH